MIQYLHDNNYGTRLAYYVRRMFVKLIKPKFFAAEAWQTLKLYVLFIMVRKTYLYT